jgi:hypothetical protein
MVIPLGKRFEGSSPMSHTATVAARGVDPRGLRFVASVTAALLIAALLLGPVAGLPVLIVQALAFAAGALAGLSYQPWSWLFRTAVRPRLGAPAELEPAGPPRFAQAVGLAFAVVGVIGALAGWTTLFYAAIGLALVAALLNALFNFCLGCELYLLGKRVLAR